MTPEEIAEALNIPDEDRALWVARYIKTKMK